MQEIESRNQILKHTLRHLIDDKGNIADCEKRKSIFNKYYQVNEYMWRGKEYILFLKSRHT